MVAYKLYYFDARGLTEPIRLLLNYAGQQFEDVRYTQETWPDHKGKFFYAKVPVLELENGKQLNQSATIARYLAEKHNLAGKDEWEKAKVNEVVDFQKDVYSELAPYFYNVLGYREGNKEQLRKDVYEPGVARILPLYEKLLKESGSGFFAPSGLTFVDFMVADYLNTWVERVEPDMLKNHPELVAFVKRVHSLPQLQSYIASRPSK